MSYAVKSVRHMWYTLWTEIAVIILDIMRHMWPRTACAYCGTRCGENMPCPSVHSLSTKNYTKIVTFIYVWLFLG